MHVDTGTHCGNVKMIADRGELTTIHVYPVNVNDSGFLIWAKNSIIITGNYFTMVNNVVGVEHSTA